MRRVFQSRLSWVVVAFVTGAVAAFTWGLLRPHPASAYRAALDGQRLDRGGSAGGQ